MIFLQRLSELIQSRGITKNKLFSTLGINRNSFVDWEKHNSLPNGEVLAKIADYFGVSVDYLLGQEEESERATDFLPERLREAIEEIGFEEFYQRFHYKPKIISDYLEGKRKPLNATLFQIATDLGVNPEWLYGHKGVPKYKNPAPMDGDGPDRNVIKIAGRDGSFIERELTDEQIAALKLMLDQFPKVDDL